MAWCCRREACPVESVFQGLLQALDQFDVVMEQGIEGRRTHVGASGELDTVADQVVALFRGSSACRSHDPFPATAA